MKALAWLRWQGAVAFAVIVAAVVAAWLLFADYLLERAVESAGTEIVGARVELDAASLDLFPVKVALMGLQVTNPSSPMRNALQAERIAFGMSTGEALFGNTHIDELTARGVAVNTPRETSGAIGGRRTTSAAKALLERSQGSAEQSSIEIPDAETILSRAELDSLAEVRELDDRLEARRKAMDKRVKELPDDAAAERYRERLDEIRSSEGGVKGRLRQGKKMAELRSDLREDIANIKSVRGDIAAELAAGREELAAARRAPMEQARKLAADYAPGGENLGNWGKLLLGPTVGGWLTEGWVWFERLRPYLASTDGDPDDGVTAVQPVRAEGLNILYPRADTPPETLLELIELTGGAEGQTIAGSIRDVARPATHWPEPATLDLRGSGIPGLAAFSLDGTLDHRDPADPHDHIDLRLQNMAVGAGESGKAAGGPIALREARADVAVTAEARAEEIDIAVQGTFREASFGEAPADAGAILRAVSRALQGIDRFTLSARVTGTPEKPRIRVDSSLEGVVRQALGDLVEERLAEVRSDLEARIRSRVEDPIGAAEQQLDKLAGLENTAGERQERFQSLLQRTR